VPPHFARLRSDGVAKSTTPFAFVGGKPVTEPD
jgi:hypothetical protein